MTYKHPAKTIRLQFEDYEGLEVVMRSAPVGDVMDLIELADAAKAGTAKAGQVNRLFSGFADRLVEWNLAGDDDEPVPADLAGVRSLDMDLFLAMFGGWLDGMTAAPKASPDGRTRAAGLPMTPLRS